MITRFLVKKNTIIVKQLTGIVPTNNTNERIYYLNELEEHKLNDLEYYGLS